MMLNHLILGQSLVKAPLDQKSQRSRAEAPRDGALMGWLKAELAALSGALHRSQLVR